MSESEAKPAPSNRKFYLLAAAFLLAAVLMGVVSALRSGPTELERYKAELQKKGEKLSLAELFPAAILTNHPPFRTNDLANLARQFTAQNMDVENFELMHDLGGGLAEPIWVRTNLLTASSRNSLGGSVEWGVLEADLAVMESRLADARSLAASPDAHSGKDYRFTAPYSEHSRNKRVLAGWLAADHILRMRQGKFHEALTDLEATMQLVDWHREELKLGDQISRLRTATVGLHVTWATLQESSVPVEHLTRLLTRWRTLTLASNLQPVLQVSRAVNLSAFALAREKGASVVMGESLKVLDILGSLTLDADEAYFLLQTQAILTLSRRGVEGRSFALIQSELASKDTEIEALYSDWRGFKFLLTRSLLGGNAVRLQRQFFRYETYRELTLAALALELHRRKHGRHPDSLNRLVPEFLPVVPVDWMDGQPLRYRLNPDGSFTLWSVGDNLTDDVGDASGPPVNMRRNDIWEGRDAVWPRPPP